MNQAKRLQEQALDDLYDERVEKYIISLWDDHAMKTEAVIEKAEYIAKKPDQTLFYIGLYFAELVNLKVEYPNEADL